MHNLIIIPALLLFAATLFTILRRTRGQCFANAKAAASLKVDDPLAALTLIASELGLNGEITHDLIIGDLRRRISALSDAEQTIDQLKQASKAKFDGDDAKDLAARIASGLDRDKAVTVMLAQKAHDATKPHDKAPKD